MAKVLTGISGNLISAASAGFAPTNSADVSAIASAYQVVSATATQLYAGTAYVTSVNGAPLSASRAGNAANASLATSAWYDGTGRLISSLPDSAAVSAIASAYAESAASGKQDELTFSYDENDRIDGINGSALAGQGGGGGSVASPSGTIIVTDGTAIEATNSAIGTAEGFEVLGSSGTYSYSYGSFYASLGGYNPFKARGIGITYISSTGDRTASVSANTPDGNFEASFELPASSVSAGVIFSDTPIYSVYDIKLKVNGTTVTLSGTNPALFLTPGTPYTVVKELAWKEDVPTLDLGIYSDSYGTYVSSINGNELSASKAFSSRSAASASYANSDAQGRALTALAAKSSIPSGVSSPSATIITDGFSVEATNSAVATGTVAGYPLQSVTYTADNPYASLGPDGAFTVTLPEHPNAVLAIDVGWLSYASTVSAVYGYKTATAAVPTGRTTALLNISNSTTARLYCDNYCNLNGASASAESATAVMGVGELAWASALPTYSYDSEDKISAINGSAIAGGGGGGTEYSGIAPIHVDNYTHEISADVVNMDLQQITHDDTMVHVSNSASYALGVNYNYSGAPWNEGLVLKSGLLYSSNNPASSVTSYALSDDVSSYYKLDVNFYDINDWHTRMECLIPSGILPSGTRGGYFNAVADLPNNVWFKCFRWSAIGTNWYCQVDEIAGTNGTNTPTFNVNHNANPPKVLSIVGWYKDSI